MCTSRRCTSAARAAQQGALDTSCACVGFLRPGGAEGEPAEAQSRADKAKHSCQKAEGVQVLVWRWLSGGLAGVCFCTILHAAAADPALCSSHVGSRHRLSIRFDCQHLRCWMASKLHDYAETPQPGRNLTALAYNELLCSSSHFTDSGNDRLVCNSWLTSACGAKWSFESLVVDKSVHLHCHVCAVANDCSFQRACWQHDVVVAAYTLVAKASGKGCIPIRSLSGQNPNVLGTIVCRHEDASTHSVQQLQCINVCS